MVASEQHLFQTIVQFDKTIVFPRKLAMGSKQFILRRISDKIVTQRRFTSLSHLTYIDLYDVCFCK